MDQYIGIDLGTSNSTVSFIETEVAKKIDVISELKSLPIYQLDDNKQLKTNEIKLPSALYFELNQHNKKVYTGEYGKSVYASGDKPMQSIKSIKTRIGGEAVVEVPYENNPSMEEKYDITDCSAILLKTIKESTEEQLNSSIKNVVVTVPAAFNNDEREAVKNAILLAGFEQFDILDEPTAVLLYEINRKANDLFSERNDENYLIYDIGGGTLDVTIAKISKTHKIDINILARSPRRNFGGDDFDKFIAAYLLENFERTKYPIEKRTEEEQMMIIARLVSKGEEIKIELNKKVKEGLVNPKKMKKAKIYADFELIKDLRIVKVKVDKDVLDNLFYGLVHEEEGDLIMPINESLKLANLTKNDIGKIILTGGSSDFYIVEEAIKNFFNKNINITYVQEETAVSKGAAIYNYHTSGGESGIPLNVEDRMDDDIYLKEGDEFRKVISKSDSLKRAGSFDIEIIEENQSEIGLFLYYGIGEDVESYIPIEGKFISLIMPMEVGEKIKVNWELDRNKIMKFYITELGEELVLKNLNSYSLEDIKNNKINDLIINSDDEY